MSPRLALLTLTLVACTGDTAPSPGPATEIAGWAPEQSEVTIPVRVQFPAGTPDDERARVVVEASKPVTGEEDDLQRHSLRNMPVFVEVDGAFVSDGEVVHLRLPVEAEFTRARVNSASTGSRRWTTSPSETNAPSTSTKTGMFRSEWRWRSSSSPVTGFEASTTTRARSSSGVPAGNCTRTGIVTSDCSGAQPAISVAGPGDGAVSPVQATSVSVRSASRGLISAS